MICAGISKNVDTENGVGAKFCQQIKDGTLILPEDAPQSPKIKKDLIVDRNFECVTDLATTWKYFTNRVQALEMFDAAGGVVKDSM